MQNRLKNQSKKDAEKYHQKSLKDHPKSIQDGSRNFLDFPGNRPRGDPETNERPKRHQEHPRDSHQTSRMLHGSLRGHLQATQEGPRDAQETPKDVLPASISNYNYCVVTFTLILRRSHLSISSYYVSENWSRRHKSYSSLVTSVLFLLSGYFWTCSWPQSTRFSKNY